MTLPPWVLGELVTDLSEFLGREKNEITEFMNKETYISEYFDEYFGSPYITDNNRELLSMWIRESQFHLFSLTRWHTNRTEYFNELYRKTKLRTDWTLLDFGSGIGTYSIIYALKKWKTTLCDINEPCLAFSQTRFEKRKLEASFVSKVSEVDYFDKVLLFDTIGHLEEPEETLATIAKSMRGGALMDIAWDLFNEPVRSHIWNKKNRTRFENILSENGLVAIDATASLWGKKHI